MENSVPVDLDEMAHYEPFHLDLQFAKVSISVLAWELKGLILKCVTGELEQISHPFLSPFIHHSQHSVFISDPYLSCSMNTCPRQSSIKISQTSRHSQQEYQINQLSSTLTCLD